MENYEKKFNNFNSENKYLNRNIFDEISHKVIEDLFQHGSYDGCDNLSQLSACPHCKSKSFIKYGKYKEVQRFRCKSCFRTFSSRTNTVWYYSKKDNEVWSEFLKMQIEFKSLAFCAKVLNINIATAFYWRHKLFNVLKLLTEPQSLSNHVFMLHRFIRESFKGDKKAFIKSRSNIWMIFSYDGCDNSLTAPYSKNGWQKKNFENIIYSKVNTKTYIYTSGNNYLRAFAVRHNKRLREPAKSSASIKVDEILKLYQAIIRKSRGISTKYLNHYMGLVKVLGLNKVFQSKAIFNNIINDKLEKYYIRTEKIKQVTSLEF